MNERTPNPAGIPHAVDDVDKLLEHSISSFTATTLQCLAVPALRVHCAKQRQD